MKRWITIFLVGFGILTGTFTAFADDFMVYSVYRGVDLGNPNEAVPKDFYVNMGSAQGLRTGATLDVLRKVSSYDLVSQKLYRDLTFPIAKLKVIHVEKDAAIARLDQMNPVANTPAISPKTVMVGDLVRKVQ